MAKTYGLDSFGQIEGIRYTFNAEFPGVKLSRKWEWNPKTDTVSYEAKDKEGKPIKATYQRSQLGSQSDVIKNEIDRAFINDQYWLLFPFHVVWDGGATVTDEGMHKLPLGNAAAERVVVKYPSEGGGSPGNTWELYVGDNKRIEELIFHRGGTKKPSVVIATWADYKKAGHSFYRRITRGQRMEILCGFLFYPAFAGSSGECGLRMLPLPCSFAQIVR